MEFLDGSNTEMGSCSNCYSQFTEDGTRIRQDILQISLRVTEFRLCAKCEEELRQALQARHTATLKIGGSGHD